MAEILGKTQNRMSSTCDELDQLIRALILYVSKFEGDCEIETPYPRDGHMVRPPGRQEAPPAPTRARCRSPR